MRITVLNENTAGKRGFLAEHGLSLLIEHNERRWLFDTGQTAVFLKNAQLLGESLTKLDGIILSHGHFDHCGGLEYLVSEYKKAGKQMPFVYVRKNAFLNKIAVNSDGRTYRIIGIPWKRELIEHCVHLTGECQQIENGVWILGNVPYRTEFEKKPDVFFIDDGEMKIPDYMEDEQMMIVETEQGLCLFAGCCHAGIINCLEYVKNAFPGKKIHCLLAGMHLTGTGEERLKRTVEELKKQEIGQIIPVHCTGLEAIGKIKAEFGEHCKLAETGKQFEI